MPFAIVHNPNQIMTRLVERVKTAKNARFVLCVAGTHTSDIEGLSAAGATPADRRLTPRYDAEALINGLEGKASALPVSPEGIVSPVVITASTLRELKIPVTIADCGTFDPPRLGEVLTIKNTPAQCLSSGKAMPIDHVNQLFEKGVALGRELAQKHDLIVIGECVPAGTTTAFAVLTGLGYNVTNAVSSSMPNLNHDTRSKLTNQGLTESGLLELITTGDPKATLTQLDMPLNLVAAIGDPMQPFAAGLVWSAAETTPVIMGGGSQMLAVYALGKACAIRKDLSMPISSKPIEAQVASKTQFENIGVITTSWVAFDKNARVQEIAEQVEAPFACSMLNLGASRHNGLRAYEEGHVKEGVAAGASIVLAHLIEGYSEQQLIDLIDDAYSEMVLGKVR